MLILKSTQPLSIDRYEIKLSSSSGYEIKPGRNPENPGDLYWLQIIGHGVSKWVRCPQNVQAPRVQVLYLQARLGQTKTKGLAFEPQLLLAVDVEGNGQIQTITPPLDLADLASPADQAATPGGAEPLPGSFAGRNQANTPTPPQTQGNGPAKGPGASRAAAAPAPAGA